MKFEEPLEVTLRHLAASGIPIVAVDDAGRIAFWSENAFGNTASSVLGVHLDEILQLEDARGRRVELVSCEPGKPFVAFFVEGSIHKPVHCVPVRLANRSGSVLTLLFFASSDTRERHPLTPRELEVVRLLASGVGTRNIAAQLHISPTTVRNHVQNVLRKLDLHSRIEIVAWARRQGLLGDNDEVAS